MSASGAWIATSYDTPVILLSTSLWRHQDSCGFLLEQQRILTGEDLERIRCPQLVLIYDVVLIVHVLCDCVDDQDCLL